MAFLDIPNLTEKIKKLVSTYKNSTMKFNDDNDDELFNSLRPFLRNIVYNVSTQNPTYWSAGGIRMEAPDEFEECLVKIKKNAVQLGKGAFGAVYNVPVNTCLKHIPKKVKHVGVKIESLKSDYNPSQTPKRLKEVVEIAKRAGELNIGPKFYDCFVSVIEGEVKIIKSFEIIDGQSWGNTEWKTTEEKADAVDKLNDAIHKMNEAGIIHHDLHSGNVMVGTNGKIYIIDYDMAKYAGNEESDLIYEFNDTKNNPWMPPGALSDKGLKYIYTKLMEDGTIKVTSANKSSVNNSPVNNSPGNKTRKNKKE